MTRRALAAFVLVALSAGSALAQNPTPEAGVRDSIRDMVSRVEALETEVAAELEAAGEVEGDEQMVRHIRSAKVRRELLDALHDLAEMVARARKSGVDLDGAENGVEGKLVAAGGTLLRDIRELEREIRAQRQALSQEAPARRPAVEARLADWEAWLDSSFEALDQNLRDRASLELPVEQPGAVLDELLQERAVYLAGHLDLATARLEQMRESGVDPNSADTDADVKAEHRMLMSRRAAAVEALNRVADLMERRGLETARFREQLIRTTGEITTDVFDPDVARGLLSDAWNRAGRQLMQQGPRLVFKALVLLFILVASWAASRIARRVVRSMVTNSKLRFSRLLQDFFVSMASRAILLIGLLIALSQMGLEVGPILAGLGVAGFIVGFALQDTLSNFAAGLMILVYRPFDEGDTVEAGGVFGNVRNLSLVNTTIVTFDNQVKIVPNTKIWGEVINNITAEDIRRVDMTFGISYSDDLRAAEAVFRRLCDEHPKVLDDPPPMIHVNNLGDSSVDFIVRPWTKTEDYWSVYWDMTREVKLALDEAGITIPFPQRDVHLDSGPMPVPDPPRVETSSESAPTPDVPPPVEDPAP